MRKDNMAELLSFLRAAIFTPLAVLGIVCGAWKDWDWAWTMGLIMVSLAAFSDCADGWCYNRWGCRRRWFGRNGKVSNDRASGCFSTLVPAAMVISLGLAEWRDWPVATGDTPWFELWLWWGVLMVIGTFIFNQVKECHIIDEALSAEVMQGLLQSLILLSLAVQCSYFAFGNNRFAYYCIGAASVVLLLWRRDRWFNRPESAYDGTTSWSQPVNSENP